MWKKYKNFLIIFFLLLTVFTRFYNLDSSATFFWDPAYDLMKIHQYAIERTITLIGPIAENNTNVSGSLTYYLYMPFAVLGKFDPLSTAVGAAFYGFLTALILLFLTKKMNKKLILYMAALMVVFFPLVEISRWAWNPNLVPFSIALGILFYQFKKPISFFFCGLILGLSLHLHPWALFAMITFVFLATLVALKERNFKFIIFFLSGLIVAVLPFIIFDLRHPPGLFLTRAIYFSPLASPLSGFSLFNFFARLWQNFISILFYYARQPVLVVLLGILLILLFLHDLKKRREALFYILPWLGQIILISFLRMYHIHYFLPGLIFFLVWLIFPRIKMGEILAKSIIIILITGSLFTIIPQLQTNPLVNRQWLPNIKTVRMITDIMEETIRRENLKEVNLAVLGSQDFNTYGWKYRSLLLIRGIDLKDKDQYSTSNYLFVVSQSSEEQLRKDPAFEMHKFRKNPLKGQWVIPDSNWRVYLF